jgi:hypothetical protein
MPLTIHDITPIGLCTATQEMMDAKRYQANFCDNLILRARDTKLEPKLTAIKRELNSSTLEKKYLEGHKAAIIHNIDKIMASVSARYAPIDLRAAEGIIASAKELIEKILAAENFDQLAALEPTFKARITLPVYSLFIESMKRAKVSVA